MQSLQLFSQAELVTYAGAVGIVVVVTNGLAYAFGLTARWIGLMAAAAVSFTAALLSPESGLSAWILAIPNSFAIYLGSVGGAALTSSTSPRQSSSTGAVEETLPIEQRFWVAWY